MNSAKVLVIDEDPKDATALLSALGRLGIGAVYVPGNTKESIPAEKISGIRIVFLDLQLIDTFESQNYVPHAVNVMLQSVDFGCRTIGVICWTKNEAEVQMVGEILEQKGIQTVFLTKFSEKAKLVAAEDPKAILEQITSLLDKQNARKLLWQFEGAVSEAVAKTCDSLTELCSSDEELNLMLASLTFGASEEEITKTASETTAIETLQIGLNGLLQDEIEIKSQNVEAPYEGKFLVDEIGKLRDKKLSLAQRAALNGALLFSNTSRFQPGNVYIKEGWKAASGFPHDVSGGNLRSEVYDFFCPENEKGIVKPIAKNAVPCVVEITPSCDFAQGKKFNARFVNGLLIPDSEESNLPPLAAKKRVFAKELPVAYINNGELGFEGTFRLTLNARQIQCTFDDLSECTPLCRVRHTVFSDVRLWLASHAARPGFVAVT